MSFKMPTFNHPDFTDEKFINAPDVKYIEAEMDGVAPEYYHSTSMYPEYFKIDGKWTLAKESRMDSSVVINPDGSLSVVENRNIKKGDKVLVVIGPEGGFSQKEFDCFKEKSLEMLTLGDLILRAETAVVVALGNIIYEYSNFNK